MEWTPPAALSQSDTKAPRSSIAKTVVCSASHPCGTFAACARQAQLRWNWPAIATPRSNRTAVRRDHTIDNHTTVFDCAARWSPHCHVRERPETWVTDRTGHTGYTFPL